MIDMQERLLPAIFNKDEIIKNSVRILTAAKELSVPVIATEQYPKGIGPTVPEIKNLIPEGSTVMEKYNLNVVIAADACGSRDEKNHALALEAARSLGCLVVPTETVVYHMLEKAGTPQFKALLPLFK